MVTVFIQVINLLTNCFIFLVIIHTVLSFFLSPYHPIRGAIDRILDPLLRPIRKVFHPVGTFDFSPLILIIMVEILSYLLVSFLRTL